MAHASMVDDCGCNITYASLLPTVPSTNTNQGAWYRRRTEMALVATASCETTLAVLRRVQSLANGSGVDWKRAVSQDANGVAKVPRNPKALPSQIRALSVLRQIQTEIARLPSQDPSFRWLAMTMVNSRPDARKSLRLMLGSVACDFSIFHFDAISTADPVYAPYATAIWYNGSQQIVHRAFRTGSGCQVEAYRTVLSWVMFGTTTRYSHLWLLDIDMDFRLFSYQAFRALVAFRRPFLCQPAMLALKKGARATDRWSLASAFSVLQPAGRERLQDVQSKFPLDDVDNQPLIDSLMFPALYAALRGMDSRNQWAQAAALNIIAREFGKAAGPWPPPSASDELSNHGAVVPSRWPAGMVFDWTPLIHRNTKLLGWGPMALKLRNGTRCPRFGKRKGFGRWEDQAEPVLQKLRKNRPREASPCRSRQLLAAGTKNSI